MGYYKRIRDLREDHDLTQRQLAARLRMTQTQYFRYEQGYRDIPSDILIAPGRSLRHIHRLYLGTHRRSPVFRGPRGSEPAWGGNGALPRVERYGIL